MLGYVCFQLGESSVVWECGAWGDGCVCRVDPFFVDLVALLNDDRINGRGYKDWLDEAVVHSCVEPIHDVVTMSVIFREVGIVLVFFVVRTDSIDGNKNQLGDGGAALVDQSGCEERGDGVAYPVLFGSSFCTRREGRDSVCVLEGFEGCLRGGLDFDLVE